MKGFAYSHVNVYRPKTHTVPIYYHYDAGHKSHGDSQGVLGGQGAGIGLEAHHTLQGFGKQAETSFSGVEGGYGKLLNNAEAHQGTGEEAGAFISSGAQSHAYSGEHQGGYNAVQGGYAGAQGGYTGAQGGYSGAQGGYAAAEGSYGGAESAGAQALQFQGYQLSEKAGDEEYSGHLAAGNEQSAGSQAGGHYGLFYPSTTLQQLHNY